MPDDSDIDVPDTIGEGDSSSTDSLAGVFIGMNVILLYLYFTYGPLIYQNTTDIPEWVYLALGLSYMLLFSVLLSMGLSYLWKTIFNYSSGPSIRDAVSLSMLTIYIPLVTSITFFGISPITAIKYVFSYLGL